MVKPGIKTTEFLVTVATDAAILAAALQGSLPPKWAAIAGSIAQLGYAISRGWAKSGTVVTPVNVAPPPQG